MLTLTVYIRSLFHIVSPPPPHFFLFRSHSLILCFFVFYFFFAKFLKFLACFIFSAIIRVVLVLLTLRSQSPTQSGYDYVVMHNFIRIIHKRQKKTLSFSSSLIFSFMRLLLRHQTLCNFCNKDEWQIKGDRGWKKVRHMLAVHFISEQDLPTFFSWFCHTTICHWLSINKIKGKKGESCEKSGICYPIHFFASHQNRS